MFRRTLFALAAGAALGLVASMWWGPGLITWWFTPPGYGIAANMCTDRIKGATIRLVQWQLGSGFGLGVVLAVLANVWAKRRHAAQNAKKPAA